MDTETLKKIKNGVRPSILIKNKIKSQNQSSANISLTPSLLSSPK
jgi:hypothetical protein